MEFLQEEEEKEEVEKNVLWDVCLDWYIKGRNGNIESFTELEKIIKKNKKDLICFGYFHFGLIPE